MAHYARPDYTDTARRHGGNVPAVPRPGPRAVLPLSGPGLVYPDGWKRRLRLPWHRGAPAPSSAPPPAPSAPEAHLAGVKRARDAADEAAKVAAAKERSAKVRRLQGGDLEGCLKGLQALAGGEVAPGVTFCEQGGSGEILIAGVASEVLKNHQKVLAEMRQLLLRKEEEASLTA
eukprot:TRINITY_DN7487_c0_g1_i2.p1 TRINITY_DN7487_c0_g1~~TRINITY_DN7487_c0_g1_i2.p1  ORF type:complete len:175 (+),score=28.77 TRINITY_DN7487_c0_g1_i2:57-581(+)